MANYGIYDFPSQIEGDTLKGKSFILEYFEAGVLRPLTNAVVTFSIFTPNCKKDVLVKSSSNNEIIITDPIKCIITVKNIPQIDETDTLPHGNYNYVLKVEYPDGLEHTFIGGKYTIVCYPQTEKIAL